jgi:hypothetical protein
VRTATVVPSPSTPPGAHWIVAAIYDLNEDGDDDLLWQNVVEGSLRVWHMAGTVMLSTTLLTANRGNDPSWRVVGTSDLTSATPSIRDGKRDLVWWHPVDGWVQVWAMDAWTRVAVQDADPNRVADVAWRPVAVVDINGDQANDENGADLLWLHTQGSWYAWFLHGLGLFDSVWMDPVQAPSGWVVLGSMTRGQ